MKRALTLLVAVVSCWTVSFVQAANVELHFYSGASNENASVVEDLHFAVVGLDGNTVVKGNLDAESKGMVEATVESTNFYVVAEQSSTKFFGSVLVEQEVVADDLFLVLDETGLTWLKDAHRCSDEECKANRDEAEKNCLDSDDCDENCVCRKLEKYLSEKAKTAEISESYAQAAGGVGAPSSSTIPSATPSTASNFGSSSSAGGAAGGAAGAAGAAAGAAGAGIGGALSSIGMAVAMGVALPVSVSAASKKQETSTAGTAVESE